MKNANEKKVSMIRWRMPVRSRSYRKFIYIMSTVVAVIICLILLSTFQSIETRVSAIEIDTEGVKYFDPGKSVERSESVDERAIKDIFYPLSINKDHVGKGFSVISAPQNDLPVMKGIHFVGVVQTNGDAVKVLISDDLNVRAYKLGDTLSDKKKFRITEVFPNSVIVADREGHTYMILK